MLKQISTLSMIAALVAAAPTDAQAGKGKAQPFSISVTAMQDVNANTDVTITTHVEQDGLTAPDLSKHIQMKSFDTEGELRWTQNYQNAALNVAGDNTSSVTYTYTDMERHQPAKIIELVQTDEITKTKVLRGNSTVLFRPDITVTSVSAPAQVVVNDLVNITALIEELNGDLGADSTIELSLDGTVLDSASSVVLNPNSDAAVTMVTSFDTAGTYTLTVNAKDINPGDYDMSNNSNTVTIEVIEDIELVQGQMYYHFQDYEYYNTWSNWYGSGNYYHNGKHESFYSYYQIPAQIEFPISVNMALTVDGTTNENYVSLDNIQPTYSYDNGCHQSEYASIQLGDQKWVYVSTWSNCYGQEGGYVQPHQYAADYVYHSQRWSYYYGNYSYHYDVDQGEFLHAQTSISTDMEIRDNTGQAYGGVMTIDLTKTPIDYSWNNGYNSGWQRGHYINGSYYGMTE
jgi:hypothetical protein